MKPFLLPGCLILLFLSPLSAQAEIKIGVIDLQKAFSEYYKTKLENAKLNQKAQQYQLDFQQIQTRYQLATAEAEHLQQQARDPILSPDARKDKTSALQQKVQDIRDMENQMQEMKTQDVQALQQEQMQETKAIIVEINQIVTAYATQSGYDIMLDKSGLSVSGTSFCLYVSPKLTDITPEIITKLNSTKPPGLVIPTVPSTTNGAPAKPSTPAAAPTTDSTPAGTPTVHY